MKAKFFSSAIACMVLTSGFFFTSCKKDQSAATVTADSTKAVASYDPSVSFTNFKTIAVADSVSVVNGTTVTKELTGAEDLYRQNFIDSLTARGFSIVSTSASPDLVLNLTRIASTSSGMVDNAGYWNNYSGVYNPTFYGEPTIPYTVNFTTSQTVNDGVLSFELIDLKDAATNNNLNIVWDGLISGYTLFNANNMVITESGVLFAKSPYLKNQ